MELYWSVCADMEFCPPLTPYQLTMIQNKQLHIYLTTKKCRLVRSIIMLINSNKLMNINTVPYSYKKINKSSILVCRTAKNYINFSQDNYKGYCDCCGFSNLIHIDLPQCYDYYPFWGLVGRILPIVKIIFLYSIGKILFTLKI